MKELWTFVRLVVGVTGVIFIISFYLGWASHTVVWLWKMGWGVVDFM